MNTPVEKLVFEADASSMIQVMKNMHRSFGELGGDSKKFSDAITNVSGTLSKAENYLGSWMNSTTKATGVVRKSTTAISDAYESMSGRIKRAVGSSILEIQRLQGIAVPGQKSALSLSPAAIIAEQTRISQGDAARKQNIFGAGQSSMTAVNNLTASTLEAEKAAQKLTFTWRTAVRIFESFIIYRGIYAIGFALKDAVSSAADFQVSISRIRTISQSAQLSFSSWTTGIRELSDEFGNPILDTASGTYELISNQITEGAKAFDFMREASKLALVTFSSTEQTVNALSGIIKAYGLDTSDAAEVSAKLFKTIDLGRVKMEDLAGSIGDVSAVANLLGVDLDELLAAISSISIRSVNPRNTLTQLRNIFSQLLKPSDDMKEALRSIGYESGEDLIRINQLSGALEKLVEVKPDLEGLAEIFRNVRGFAGAAILSRDMKGFKDNILEMQNATEAYNKAFEISMESTGKKLQIEVNRIKNFFTVELGQSLLEGLGTVSQAMGGFDVVVKVLADSLTFLLVPAILLATKGIERLRLAALANPYTAIIAATAAIIITVKELDEANRLIEERILQDRVKKWKDFADRIIQEERRIGAARLKAFQDMSLVAERATADVVAGINKQQDAASEAAKSLSDNAREAVTVVLTVVRDTASQLNSKLNEAEASVKRLDRAMQDLKESSQEQAISTKLNDQTPAVQIGILQTEIKRLFNQGTGASTFEDVEFSFKKALDYANQIRSITDKYEKEQEKIQKEITKAHDEYEKTDTRLRKQQDKGKIGTRSQIKQQREDLKTAYEQTVKELQGKLADLGTLPVKNADVDRAINAIIAQHAKGLKKLREDDAINVTKLSDKQLKYEKTARTIETIQRLTKEQDVQKILAKENINDVQKEMTERQKLLGDTATQLEKNLPSAPEDRRLEIELTIGEIRRQQLEEYTALRGEFNKRSIQESSKELQLKKEAYTTEYKSLQARLERSKQILANAERNKQLGEETFRDFVKRSGGSEADIQDVDKVIPGIGGLRTRRLREMRRAAYESVGAGTPESSQQLLDSASKNNSIVAAQMAAFLKSLPAQFEAITGKIEPVTKTFKQQVDDASGAFDAYIAALSSLTIATQRAASGMNPTGVPIVPGRAFGGMVSRGTDSILALLSPGEYVMNAKSTRKYYSQLVAMNSAIPGFASGGPVTNVNGDFNISLQPSGNNSADVQEIGRLLRREIRRGTVSLS